MTNDRPLADKSPACSAPTKNRSLQTRRPVFSFVGAPVTVLATRYRQLEAAVRFHGGTIDWRLPATRLQLVFHPHQFLKRGMLADEVSHRH